MTIIEALIVTIIIIGVFVSLTGKPEKLVSIWHNYYIGKKYYLWMEVLFILFIVLVIGISLIGLIIGGYSD